MRKRPTVRIRNPATPCPRGSRGAGDGIVNDGGVEECDDNDTVPGDGCNATCLLEYCGDGVVNNGGVEECDDGNTTPDDGCDELCGNEPFFEDGFESGDLTGWSASFP